MCEKLKTSLKQINNKRTLVNLYKDIALVTRVRIFCSTLFTNNNIKVVIQIDAFLAHLQCLICLSVKNRKKGLVIFLKIFSMIYYRENIQEIPRFKIKFYRILSFILS